MPKEPSHTDNLRPHLIDQENPQYSEWDIRRAWDNALAGTRITHEISTAFSSFAFKVFLEELKKSGSNRTDTRES